MREFRSKLLFVLIGILGSLALQIIFGLDLRHQLLAAIVMVVSVAALAVWVWMDFRQQSSRDGRTDGRLPVKDASRLMYNKADLATRGFAASMTFEESSDPAWYFLSALFIEGTKGSVKIYGRRGHGLKLELIPASELDDVHDVHDGKIVPLFKDGPAWLDPCISKSDALRVLQMYTAPKVKN